MSLVLHRPAKRVARQAVNFVITALVSGYFLYVYQSSGWTYDIVCGVIFGLWALYVLWNMASRRTVFEETSAGFTALGPFGRHSVAWDALFAIGGGAASENILLIVYKKQTDEKERFLALSRRSCGSENIDLIAQLIAEKRPGLPAYVGGKAVSA